VLSGTKPNVKLNESVCAYGRKSQRDYSLDQMNRSYEAFIWCVARCFR